MRTMIAFGGKYPTSVIPSTVVLDRQYWVAAGFCGSCSPQTCSLRSPLDRRAGFAVKGFAEIATAAPTAFGSASACPVLAGLVSFASPCVVPLVPGYLSYLAAVVGVEEEPATAG